MCFLFNQSSHTVVSDSLRPHGLKHARLPCPSPPPRVCSNSCPLSQWCHLAISSSVILCSSSLQFCLASGSFPMNQSFASGGQSIGASASASVFPVTGLIFLLSKWLLGVSSPEDPANQRFSGCRPHGLSGISTGYKESDFALFALNQKALGREHVLHPKPQKGYLRHLTN